MNLILFQILGYRLYLDKTSWDNCQEEFSSKFLVRRILRCCLAGNLLSSTGKPLFPSERGRGTRKENELNHIPHPTESYHASGGSASAQLPAGMQDKFNKRWEMGVGERDGITGYRGFAWPARVNSSKATWELGFRSGTGLTPLFPEKDGQLLPGSELLSRGTCGVGRRFGTHGTRPEVL